MLAIGEQVAGAGAGARVAGVGWFVASPCRQSWVASVYSRFHRTSASIVTLLRRRGRFKRGSARGGSRLQVELGAQSWLVPQTRQLCNCPVTEVVGDCNSSWQA